MSTMTDQGDSAETSLSLAALKRIDRVCLAFEDSWKNGQTPRIETFLADFDGPERSRLLYELLYLELNYRSCNDESPSVDEYRSRFACDTALVDMAVEKVSRAAAEHQRLPWVKVDQVRQKNADGEATAQPGAGLYIRCPHCGNPVETAEDVSLAKIICSSCGDHFSLVGEDTEADRRAVTTIGHFDLIERLGVGRFGTVWKARDTQLDRTVAIKIPRSAWIDPADAEKFLREARAAAQLNHPNIVRLYEVGCDGGRVYIVSDLVEGLSLADWLNDQRLTARESAQLCAKVADALEHAHQAGVIHRDLKPANMVIDLAGEPHIMDFGLAKREVGEVTMTLDGQLLGTPAYMSPEQAKGEAHEADRRSDIYSLGVILFELLTGERPFRGSVQMLVHAVVNEPAPSLRIMSANIPRDLETIALKCLEKSADDRYNSAQELADELHRFLRNEPIAARPLSSISKGWRWCQRNPTVAGLAALIVAVLVLGTLVSATFAIRATRLARDNGELVEKELNARRTTEWNLYVSRMQPLQAAWEQRDFGRLENLLQQSTPLDGEPDFRGWEWYYFQDQLRQSRRVLRQNIDDFPRAAYCSATERIAVSTAENRIEIWNMTEARLEKTLPANEHIRCLAWTEDGAWLASARGTISIWDVASVRRVNLLEAGAAEICGLAWSPDKSKIASGDNGGLIKIWSAKSGTCLRTINANEENTIHYVHGSMSWHPDGVLLAVPHRFGRCKVWNTQTGKLAWYRRNPSASNGVPLLSVSWSPDGKKLAAGHHPTPVVWSRDGEKLAELAGHQADINCISWNHQGDQLLTASNDQDIRIWDADSGRELRTIRHHGEPVFFAHLRDEGDDSVVSVSSEKLCLSSETESPMSMTWKISNSPVFGLQWDSAGKRLYCGSWDGVIRIYDAAGTQQDDFSGHMKDEVDTMVHAIAIHPTGSPICSKSYSGSCLIWDPETKNVLHIIKPPQTAASGGFPVAWSPDGSNLAIVFNQRAFLWTRSQGGTLTQLDATSEQDRIDRSFAWSPDGTRIAIGRRQHLAVYSVNPRRRLFQVPSENLKYAVAWSPDQTLICAGSVRGTVTWYAANQGRQLHSVQGHRAEIRGVDWHPGGRRFTSVDTLGVIKLWDAATGDELVRLQEPGGPLVLNAAWSPDGRRLALACEDGTVRLWGSPDMELPGRTATILESGVLAKVRE